MESNNVRIENLSGINVMTRVKEQAQVYIVFLDNIKVATIGWHYDKLQFDAATDPMVAKKVASEVEALLERKVVMQFPPNVPDWVFNLDEESNDEASDDFDT